MIGYLEEDPNIATAEIARRLGLKYGQVRMGMEYLGLAKTRHRWLDEDKAIAAKVKPLLKQGKTYADIKRETGYSQPRIESASVRLKDKELLQKVRIPNHGTAVEYGHFGCRCMECKVANGKRLKEAYEDRKRRAATDAPHGTESGYRNWGCRCVECTRAGTLVNKQALTVDGLVKTRDHIVWSREEDEQILSYDMSAKELAVKLGRGVSAVNARRSGMWTRLEPATVVG
jgi:hypothetical protein